MHNEVHPAAAALARLLAERDADRTVHSVAARPSRHFDHLIEAFKNELIKKGVSESSIRKSGAAALPGAYDDSTRMWDLMVMENEELIAAVEFKSSSSDKNVRNRMSDAVALAADFGRAYSTSERRRFRPFLGFVFTLEENARTTKRTRSDSCATHVDRYRDFFRRLVDDEMYDAIAYLTFTNSPVAVNEPDPTLGFEGLAQAVADHVVEFRRLRKHHDAGAASIAIKLSSRNDLSHVLAALSDTGRGHTAVGRAGDELAVQRRRELLNRLREIIENPASTEKDVQQAIGRNYWLFGGQYQGILPRRDLMPFDQHDIPLVCSDRSIHIVELKRPGAALVTAHRGHLIVSTDVHQAVGQCMNYIRTIDQVGATMQTLHRSERGYDFDYLRSKGTVVIGDPDRISLPNVTREMVDQTIRSYNSHLSRVQVLTYTDLIESAERTLRFTEEELSL